MLDDGGSLRVTRTRWPRRSRSVTLDTALTARGLEAAAQLVGFIGRRERPRHGAVINPFGVKIGASNDGVPVSEFAGEFLLQRAQGRQRVGFAPLRRHLHEISPGRNLRRGCGRTHRGHPRRGRCEGTLGWRRRRAVVGRGGRRSSPGRPGLRWRGRSGGAPRRTGAPSARFGSVRPNREDGYPLRIA
jgi:hypothetical protein